MKENVINEIKFKFLVMRLEALNIKAPTREDIQRILKIGYDHSGLYLKALRENKDVK